MQLENFTKFIKYYGKGQKKGLLGFSIISIIAGLLEFAGIALVYPFILFFIKPQVVYSNKYYLNFSQFLHVSKPISCAFILGIIVVGIFIVKNLFMMLSVYLQTKFAGNWKSVICKKYMNYFLHAPYKKIMRTSPASKIYLFNFLISQSLDLFVIRGINLATNLIIVLMILALLLVKFPLSAILTGAFVIFSMIFQTKILKKQLVESSKDLLLTSQKGNDQVIENISYLRDIKILSAENEFNIRYKAIQEDSINALVKNNFLNSVPPYIMEILIVTALLILAAIISIQNQNDASALVASYAVVVAAIFRISPALNRVQTSINAINGSRGLVKLMNTQYEIYDGLKLDENNFEIVKIPEFEATIEFKNVSFSYENEKILKNINFEIKKGEFIGITGTSGAGKSTLANLISGILTPDEGEILLDGRPVTEKDFYGFRKILGYVPQEIHMLDGSIKENICMRVAKEKINDEKVKQTIKQACLEDVVDKYKDGINAKVFVGENGLSQGQKQRIAIARAIYKNAKILLFDEATSSLDVETENKIVEILQKTKGEKTIISIAHRLSTLKNCDRLIFLKNGSIVDIGSFEELETKHEDFANLVNLSNLEQKK